MWVKTSPVIRGLAASLAILPLLCLAACSGGQDADVTNAKPVELGFHEVMVDPYLPEPASGKPPETTVDELKLEAVYEKVGLEVGKEANDLMSVPTDTETIEKLAPFAELSAEEVAVLPPKVRFFVPTISCAQLDGRDESTDDDLEDGELVVTCSAEDGGGDREKYLLDEAVLGGHDVDSAKAERDPTASGERFLVTIIFDEEGKEEWAELSADNAGKQVAIVVDGRLVAAPVVQEAITSGVVQVTGDFTQTQAEKLAAGIEAGAK